MNKKLDFCSDRYEDRKYKNSHIYDKLRIMHLNEDYPTLQNFALKTLLRSMIENKNDTLVFLHGSPGIGKSAIIKSIAKEHNLKLIDIRLGQKDPTEVGGLPAVVDDPETGRKKTVYVTPDDLPLEGDPLPKDKNGKKMNGWLLFFDELNTAPNSVQAAAYQIILDRQVKQSILNENIFMMAAGNLESDRAVAFKQSTALKTRMEHYTYQVDTKAWLKYASICNSNGVPNIDYDIQAFISYKKEALYDFNPEVHGKQDKTFACPRTWEFLSKTLTAFKNDYDKYANKKGTKILTSNSDDDDDDNFVKAIIDPYSDLARSVYEGIVGDIAFEFMEFIKLKKYLPSIDQILGYNLKTMASVKPINPNNFAVSASSVENGVKYMTIFHILSKMDELKIDASIKRNDFAKVFKFVLGMGKEFATLFKMLISNNPKIKEIVYNLDDYDDFITDLK